MKQIKLNSRILTLAVVFIILFGACHNTNTNSEGNAEKETVSAPQTDIHTAAFMGNLNAIKQHIKAGSDLNTKDQYGSTPLNIAITFGKTEIALALIDAGSDLSIVNADESTPLHTAAFFCRKEIVKSLLVNGANKEAKNAYGSTPLQSVQGSFNDVKPVYELISTQLGGLGLKLDFDFIEKTRPEIAAMLQE